MPHPGCVRGCVPTGTIASLHTAQEDPAKWPGTGQAVMACTGAGQALSMTPIRIPPVTHSDPVWQEQSGRDLIWDAARLPMPMEMPLWPPTGILWRSPSGASKDSLNEGWISELKVLTVELKSIITGIGISRFYCPLRQELAPASSQSSLVLNAINPAVLFNTFYGKWRN